MKFIAYTLDSYPPDIKPASTKRDWMDATPQSFAYRCLPLNIANSHGWHILSPCRFEAQWDGGVGAESVTIQSDAPRHLWPLSHFGSGILTFHVNVLFRTESGFNLWVMGPANGIKDGIAALSGVVETDWSPYSFTMNWKFTRPNHRIAFEKDEPFCQIFPVLRNAVSDCEPEFQSLDQSPETKQNYLEWQQSRSSFIANLPDPQSQAHQEKWQKAYYRGLLPDGNVGCADHDIKLTVKEFNPQK